MFFLASLERKRHSVSNESDPHSLFSIKAIACSAKHATDPHPAAADTLGAGQRGAGVSRHQQGGRPTGGALAQHRQLRGGVPGAVQ